MVLPPLVQGDLPRRTACTAPKKDIFIILATAPTKTLQHHHFMKATTDYQPKKLLNNFLYLWGGFISTGLLANAPKAVAGFQAFSEMHWS